MIKSYKSLRAANLKLMDLIQVLLVISPGSNFAYCWQAYTTFSWWKFWCTCEIVLNQIIRKPDTVLTIWCFAHALLHKTVLQKARMAYRKIVQATYLCHRICLYSLASPSACCNLRFQACPRWNRHPFRSMSGNTVCLSVR